MIVLHLVAVAGACVPMRGRADLADTGLALPLLLLGAGSENLAWAFQTGFVGSGVRFWALALVKQRAPRSGVCASASSSSW